MTNPIQEARSSNSGGFNFSLMDPDPENKPKIKLAIMGLILTSSLVANYVYLGIFKDEFYLAINKSIAYVLTFMTIFSYNRLYSIKLPNFKRVRIVHPIQTSNLFVF